MGCLYFYHIVSMYKILISLLTHYSFPKKIIYFWKEKKNISKKINNNHNPLFLKIEEKESEIIQEIPTTSSELEEE